MAGENIYSWSAIAANNSNADTSINWAEGQPRASVNNSARSMMAAHAKQRDLMDGSIVTGGSANAQTFTSGVGHTFVPTGMRVLLGIGVSNTGPTTLNMDGIAAVAIHNQAGLDLVGGEMTLGSFIEFQYDGANWRLLNGDAVSKAGSTMTGTLTISSGQPVMQLNKLASGQTCAINATSANVMRWQMAMGDATPELGGNTGSNFTLANFTDAGAFSGNYPFTIRRADGAVSIGGVANGSYEGTADVTIKCSTTRNGLAVMGTAGGVLSSGILFLNAAGGLVGAIQFSDTNTAYQTSSDARLKSDVTEFKRGRDIIERLPIKQYKWTADNSDGVGVIAQEVQAVFPAAVSEGKGEPGEEGFMPWGVDYSKYVPPLIQALQGALAQIDELQQRIAALERK